MSAKEIKVYVNKGFYISPKGEKIELNQNSLDIVFKSDHDQALAEKALTIRKQAVEIEELRKQRNIEFEYRYKGEYLAAALRVSDAEIEAKKAEVT